jgi:hypothetical protein
MPLLLYRGQLPELASRADVQGRGAQGACMCMHRVLQETLIRQRRQIGFRTKARIASTPITMYK